VTAPIPLRSSNLGAIRALGVPVPGYDRSALTPRMLHLGVGGFHRAHMAVYTDDVAAHGSDWGIHGVGLLDGDRRMADVLRAQEHLYTVIERDSEGSRPRIVGSIVGYTLATCDARELSTRVADPEVAILSLTITEGGYALTGGNPTLEVIVDALAARRAAGARPLTILSCDNLPGNGDVARAATAEVVERRGPELARYLESCTFPNSMVDRITPQTQDADRGWLREERGVDDGWPVVCEPFRQWVIEDRFVAGRPPWQEAGVLFTDRVHDWELYKLRMLNASHSCMAYVMALAGVVYVDEAMAVPELRRYLERFLADEAIPTLTEIPEHPAADYARTTLHRFENTGVRDQIARLCIDGTAKFPSFLIPTVQRELELGGPIDCAALALAAWSRYLARTPPAERAPDSSGDRSASFAARSLDEPEMFLELDEVFPPALRASSRFREAFALACRELDARGAVAALGRVAGQREA
jgi:mannitol 2-dehydrogenase